MTLTEVKDIYFFLIKRQTELSFDADYYHRKFNNAQLPEDCKPIYQMLCELCKTQIARIDRLSDMIAQCDQDGLTAVDTMKAINFFLYNEKHYDEIDYRTYIANCQS